MAMTPCTITHARAAAARRRRRLAVAVVDGGIADISLLLLLLLLLVLQWIAHEVGAVAAVGRMRVFRCGAVGVMRMRMMRTTARGSVTVAAVKK